MFEKLRFKTKREETEFNKYIKLKGEFLYKQIYDILLENKEIIWYEEISSYVRYDKNLRDKLYIYFACAEEYLRAMLLDKYDVNSSSKRYVGHRKGQLIYDLQ